MVIHLPVSFSGSYQWCGKHYFRQHLPKQPHFFVSGHGVKLPLLKQLQMAVLYKSRFIKADMRMEEMQPDMRFAITQCGDEVILKDMFLLPGASMNVALEKDKLNLIFPIVGGVVLTVVGKELQLLPEEVYCYSGGNERAVVIENPFVEETINFLHIVVDQGMDSRNGSGICKLGISDKNRLVCGEGIANCMRVGVYDSRVKDKVSLSDGCDSSFTFIINGSFEVEDRLMEHRDGLCQWDVREIEFEALSETAIIVVIEYSQLK